MILQDLMSNVNAASENINRIEKTLFSVQDIEMKEPIEGFERPNGKMIYTNKGKWLGNTGIDYVSLQPKDFFDAVIKNVRDTGMEFDLSKLEYNVLSNGRIIEFRLPTNIISFKNKQGKTDETKMFLNFWTGFGGVSRTEIGLYSHRFICSNGMRVIDSDIDLKVKHTARMNAKALSFTESIIKVASRVETTNQMWSVMDSKEVNTETAENFVRKIVGIKNNEQLSEISTRKRNIYEGVNEALATEFSRTGSTVWGLLNTVTYFNNHLASGAKNDDYVLLKTGAKNIETAQKLALELI